MHHYTTETHSRTLVMLRRDGVFLCWLERSTRRPATGLHRELRTSWSTRLGTAEIAAGSVARLQQKVAQVLAPAP